MDYNSADNVWQTAIGPFAGGHISYYVSATDNSGRRERSDDKIIVLSPTISGNTGIAGVTMNGLPGNPVTDSDGYYIADVNSGWSGTVTPTKAGCTFMPASRIYTTVVADQNDQNYTVTQYSLGGPIILTAMNPISLFGNLLSPLPDGASVTMSGGSPVHTCSAWRQP